DNFHNILSYLIRRFFGTKPIFKESQLNKESLRLGFTRKSSRRRNGFQPNHEAAFFRINHGLRDGFIRFPGRPKSEELVKEIPRCNQFLTIGQTDIVYGKSPTNSIWFDPELSMEAMRLISTIPKTSQTSLAAPASRGSDGSSFTPTFHIWQHVHLMPLRSLFKLSLKTNSHIIHQGTSRSYQGDS
ncbi:hypothetical protein IGI04_001971, partial [Brassica rapa subsp. trilocularis]